MTSHSERSAKFERMRCQFRPESGPVCRSRESGTAERGTAGQRGATPKQFAPLFDRPGISAEIWCRLVKDFGRLFSVVAGQPQRIDEMAVNTKLELAVPLYTIMPCPRLSHPIILCPRWCHFERGNMAGRLAHGSQLASSSVNTSIFTLTSCRR